ncbi:MAG: 4Fe-4S binding protein, partial [Methylococcales bacterium]|nr:4Fe-4S binding protein [Methylococcales bacterium]
WIPENCTACGNCYSSCPDSAIPGLINTVNEVFETNIKRIEKSGHTVKHLRRAIRTVEKKYHALTADKSVGTTLDPIFAKAIGDTIKEYAEPEKDEVAQEFEWFKQAIGSFKFALTEPYHDEMNSRMPRNGGLFSITINPNSCKGCMECVTVCETEALSVVDQTTDSIINLRNNWNYWQDLPTSNKKYSRIDDLQAKNGVLDTLLLDKKNHDSMLNSDNTRAGSGEKTVIHLFTSTVTALMQPRVEQHIKHIDQLITELEKHIRIQLVETLDISDIDALETAIDENQNVDLTLSRLSGSLDKDKATQPIDPKWLKWALQLIAKLKHLKWSYTQGLSGEGRASLGMTNSGNGASTHTAAFPYNPYPFPWARHLSQDAPSLAMGLFEGHMVKMAAGFIAIRIAELEINGKYDAAEHDKFFAYFDWRQFSEDEYLLCPPLVTLGSEGSSYDSGFQSLSRSLMSGMPIKVLVLDNCIPCDNDATRKEL